MNPRLTLLATIFATLLVAGLGVPDAAAAQTRAPAPTQAGIAPARGSTSPAAQAPAFDSALVSAFTYRNLGPFRMGARISDIAAPAPSAPDHGTTFYVGTWSGGLWKTTNAGTTFEPVFDGVGTLAIGAVAVAPSDADVVWVGTGDAFTSRSSYAGDGVYRSTDAGKTWTRMGLGDTQHIARIRIDPRDPGVVYVAAMGHLYSENEERGVFKTTDGGRTWKKVLYAGPGIGVIDLVMDPTDPDVLYAATYDKKRFPWQLVNGGPGSGIYKTTDGGATWARLEGGLPAGRIGRIGLALYPRNPDVVYAVVENANPGAKPDARGRIATIGGEVYRTDDAGATWAKMNADSDDVSSKGPYYFSQIRVDPNDDQKLFVTGVSLGNSTDGGRTWHDISWPAGRLFPGIFGDVRTLWIDPSDSGHMILGSDGGVFVSHDGGRTSRHLYNIPLGEVYSVAVDNEDPYNIYAGLQDHENWKGPSNGPMGDVTVLDWLAVGNGDGIFTVPDPTDSRWLYTTHQYGGQARVDQRSGYRVDIQPRAPEGHAPYRFIWATPIVISPHDSLTLYTGGQYLLKSTDRGDHWTEISPDLSTRDTAHILPLSEGSVPGGIPWFAISTIAESPITPGLVWVGTSGGKVHVTRDGGKTWTDVTRAIAAAGGREDAYVSRVRASSHVAGRAYVAKRGYKFDDFRPYLFRTDDYGRTWIPITGDLPQEPINVVWEDRVNPDLLFVGDDEGVFVTIDAGERWVRMNNNMPDVAVHDLVVHPRENDLVVGSYGRGIWVTNIAPLQELTRAVLAEPVHLFRIEPTVQRITWSFGANDYLFASAHIRTPNEPNGMVIRYYLRDAADSVAVTITNAAGREVARLKGDGKPGIGTVVWSTRVPRGGRRGIANGRPQNRATNTAARDGGASAARTGGHAANPADTRDRVAQAAAPDRRPTPLDAWMPPGEYTVTLTVDGHAYTQTARIVGTQGWSVGRTPVVLR